MIPLGKLKRLLFIALLVVFGCEEQEKDCAGVAGGTSYEDECGGCDANVNNDCVQDCADVWGGNNICGCTDSTATNHNNIATYDDGSCEYVSDYIDCKWLKTQNTDGLDTIEIVYCVSSHV